MVQLHEQSPTQFRTWLAERGIRRFYLVWDRRQGQVQASHPDLQPLAEWMQSDRRDFDRHEGFFGEVLAEHNVLMSACIHRSCRGQGAGGVRFWPYATVETFLRDGLRLARGMTYKNALAGLWWGGGKGILCRDSHAPLTLEDRRAIYQAYGRFITSLQGAYITAEDVGTHVNDMAAVFSRTRFTTCIPPELGGSGNPSVATARGVVCALEAALEHRDGSTLEGKTVTLQGLGNVGEALLGMLHERGVAKVIASDIDVQRVARLRETYPMYDLRAVAPGDDSILSEKADVFVPCATGGVLGPDTIPRLQVSVVCGAANNQLLDPLRDDLMLWKAGITYVPDFLVNRMGIVTCANEQYGYVRRDPSADPAVARHLSRDWEHGIYRVTHQVLERARQHDEPPGRIAVRIAAAKAEELHPIWGHRGQAIIDGLLAEGWC